MILKPLKWSIIYGKNLGGYEKPIVVVKRLLNIVI